MQGMRRLYKDKTPYGERVERKSMKESKYHSPELDESSYHG